jgi:hypothetical protein
MGWIVILIFAGALLAGTIILKDMSFFEYFKEWTNKTAGLLRK